MINSGIYRIHFKGSKNYYVGSSFDLHRREWLHLWQLRKGIHHNPPLQKAFDKYGENRLVFEKLLFCSPENLTFYEQRAIDVLQPAYNICPVVGSRLGVKASRETCERISKANTGHPCWTKGRKASPELRARLSAAHIGQVAWNKGMKGVYTVGPMSDENKAKISQATRGKIRSPEARANMSRAQKARFLK